jgi:hypothetical protein
LNSVEHQVSMPVKNNLEDSPDYWFLARATIGCDKTNNEIMQIIKDLKYGRSMF